MEELEQVYIRLSDGLILFPVQGRNSQLFNWHNSDEPPITRQSLKSLNFILLKDLINKPVTTDNERPNKDGDTV